MNPVQAILIASLTLWVIIGGIWVSVMTPGWKFEGMRTCIGQNNPNTLCASTCFTTAGGTQWFRSQSDWPLSQYAAIGQYNDCVNLRDNICPNDGRINCAYGPLP